MRIFLFVLVFDMVFHSLTALTPYQRWCKELDIDTFPRRLPTPQEMEQLAERANPDNPNPVGERVMKSCDSVWDFLMPWPDSGSRKRIKTWDDGGRFTVCWLTTRLRFFEQLVRTPQGWTMFSPNAVRFDDVVRGRLVYEDGSTRVIRTSADPEDLTHHSHWWAEKILQYEVKLDDDEDARMGWCNLIAHRYPAKSEGSKLLRIYLVRVRIHYPEPGADVAEFMRAQNGPPGWEDTPPFWEYDVQKHEGRKLE